MDILKIKLSNATTSTFGTLFVQFGDDNPKYFDLTYDETLKIIKKVEEMLHGIHSR